MRRPGNGGRTSLWAGEPNCAALDAEVERLAIDAARALGAEMAGVDLIPDLDRGCLTLLEVNAVPGWRALSRVTGIDIAAAVLAALRELRG